MSTKPKGIHATFVTQCADCYCPITVTSGRPDPHDCHPISLAQLRSALGGE
jgi:hypothetical protein